MRCFNIVKYGFMIFNYVFGLGGIAVIGMGALNIMLRTRTDLLDTEYTLPDNGVIQTVSIILIVLGCIGFLVSYLGHRGASFKNRRLLIWYSICITILAAANVYLAVKIFRTTNNIESRVVTNLQLLFDGHTEFRLSHKKFNDLEDQFQCCGTTGADEYARRNLQIPETCCSNPVKKRCLLMSVFTYSGCNTAFADYFTKYLYLTSHVIIGIISLEFVAMFSALFLIHSIATKNQRTINNIVMAALTQP